MALSEARGQEFSPGTPVSSPPSSVHCSASKTKLKINAIYILSNLIAELSLRITWHAT